MFVYPQLPGGYVGVVHETDIIIAKKGRGGGAERDGKPCLTRGFSSLIFSMAAWILPECIAVRISTRS